MRFETLLFDLDGTLTNPADGFTRCVAHALERVGLPEVSRPRLESCIGPPLEDTFRELGALPNQVEALVESYRDRYRETGIFENVLYPFIPETLDSLRSEGHVLHLATSKPAVFAERILEHFEIRSFFTQVFGSNLDGSLSHKRDLLVHARETTGFVAERAAMIGDRRYDMEAACELGIHPIGVRWGYGSREELVSSGAAVVVDGPGDLLEALR